LFQKSFFDVIEGKGRSVIVVGPSLPLQQSGLPKEMAVELF
jgi:DNA-directed RNA polymerase beta' subunit